MATLPISIGSLIGGVSRQPSIQRFTNQLEEVDNATMRIERGLSKRPGTEVIFSEDTDDGCLDLDFTGLTADCANVHWIDRDPTERFVVMTKPGEAYPVRAFDLAGGSVLVEYDNTAGNPLTYINAASTVPADLVLKTSADATFILNKRPVVAMAGAAANYTWPLVCRVEGAKVIGDTSINFTGNDTLEAGVIPGMTFSIAGNAQVYTVSNSVTAINNVMTKVKFTPALVANAAVGAVVTFATTPVRDSHSGHYRDNVAAFDYPPAAAGEYWFAAGDSVGAAAGFYISQNPTTSGVKYARVHAEEANYKFNTTTMPVRMDWLRASNKFVVYAINWNERLSGDTVTNPAPMYVGHSLSDLTFHRDRLWLTSGELVDSSYVSDYFNMFLDNWRVVGDADKIETTVASSDSVNNVLFLSSFKAALVIFTSGEQQYEIRAGADILSPTSFNVVQSVTQSVSAVARPVQLGSQVYFASVKSGSGQVFEYLYNPQTIGNTAQDITLHTPGYIRSPIAKISTSTTHNLIFCSTLDDRNTLYVHRMEWMSDGQKVQQAWSRWLFDADTTIVSHHVYGDYLYLILFRDSKFWMEKVHIAEAPNDTGMPYAIGADRRIAVEAGLYDSVTDTTEWIVPFADASIDVLVLDSGWAGKAGKVISFTNVSQSATQTVLRANGRLITSGVWVGRSYEFLAQLSEQYARDADGKPVRGVLQIKTMTVTHKDAGYYEVRVTPYARETKRYSFTPQRLGSLAFRLNNFVIEEYGTFFCKPFASSEKTVIEIASRSPLPVTIAQIDMVTNFVPQRHNPAK